MLERPVDCDPDITVIPSSPQNLSPPDGVRKGEKKDEQSTAFTSGRWSNTTGVTTWM